MAMVTAMFTLIVVYQNGTVFSCQSSDLDEITNWAKLCLPDEDTTFVQVSGTLFGPVMFSSTKEEWANSREQTAFEFDEKTGTMVQR